MTAKLSHRQAAFCAEYLKTGNATEAAQRAGYSPKTAYSIGQRLLRNVEIMDEIKMHRQAVSVEAELTIARVVTEIWQLAQASKIEANKLRAYDMIMKHLGGYVTEKMIIENLSKSQLDGLYERLSKKLEYDYK